MNLYSYIAEAAATRPEQIRFGQHLFNTLPDELAERVRGTDSDPFYDDRRITAFLVWLTEQPEVNS